MIIFTDASYSSQTKVSGYGFVILDKDFDYKAGNYSFEQAKLNKIKEILGKVKLKTTIFQIKGHGKENDGGKFGYYNEVCDAIAGDYRYIGEIEKEKVLTLVRKNNKRRHSR